MSSFVVTGPNGRMGSSVLDVLKKDGQEQALIWSRDIKEPIVDSAREISGVIDFTLPAALPRIIDFCRKNRLPLVSGTTGFDEKQMVELRGLSQEVPVLWAPNMSLGVALMRRLVRLLPQFEAADFYLEDYHHRHKKDAPSGTAHALLQAFSDAGGKRADVQVHAVRAGGIYGVHKMSGCTDSEELSIEHRALNREVFAQGAVRCARWLVNQPAGFYGIDDLLNN